MASFLLRFWLNPAGTLSCRHYRMFLWIYFVGVLPTFTTVFLAFLILGWRRETGILRQDPEVKILIISTIFTVMSIWPLAVASIKRMHDLGLRGPVKFFQFNPGQGYRTFKRMLSERGPSPDED